MSDDTVSKAVRYCQENLPAMLAPLLQSTLDPNLVVPQFRYKTLSRKNVPLISIAVAYDSVDCIQLLVKSKANIECEDGSGAKPIHWACTIPNRVHSLRTLLELGAEPNPVNNPNGLSPFLLSAKSGFQECMQRLLTANVNINQQDATGRTALHLVSWFGYHSIMPILLQYNAKIDIADGHGHTALHYACWFGHVQCVNLLIDAKAPLDVQDKTGRTPLHFAVTHNKPEVVLILMKAGANPKIMNVDGKTAEMIATTDDNESILKILNDFKEVKPTESNSLVTDITEEHNRLKQVIQKLSVERDEQVQNINQFNDKIQSQGAAIQALREQQIDMKHQLMELYKILQTVLFTLNLSGTDLSAPKSAIAKHPSIPRPPTSSKPGQTQQGKPEGQKSQAMCRFCNQEVAAVRCKRCHSPICNQCCLTVKQNGCTFCLSGEKK